MRSQNHQPVANGEFDTESLHQLFQSRTQAAASHLLGNGALDQSSNGHPKDATAEPPAIRAKKIEMAVTPVCLASSAVSRLWSVEDWYHYCEQILADLGATGDPIERMMIEEFVLGHQNINRMFVASASPHSPQEADCLYAAIPRLLAELRRLALAIREYRSPMVSKVVNVVQQQNLAENQQVGYVAGPSDAPADAQVKPAGKNMPNTKLGSNPPLGLPHAVPKQFIAKPEASAGREAEPVEKSRTNSRRAAATSRNGPKKSAVAKVHRPTNGRR